MWLKFTKLVNFVNFSCLLYLFIFNVNDLSDYIAWFARSGLLHTLPSWRPLYWISAMCHGGHFATVPLSLFWRIGVPWLVVVTGWAAIEVIVSGQMLGTAVLSAPFSHSAGVVPFSMIMTDRELINAYPHSNTELIFSLNIWTLFKFQILLLISIF